MIKKQFTDGLLQIAIVLSLLRTDLNLTNLNNYVNSYPEIQEIILGSSSAYTQTHDFHSHSWHNDGINGYAHPKSIDNYYANSILGELHSLSRFRRVRQRDHDINAWLVIGPNLPSLPSETAEQSSHHTTQDQTQQNSGSQNLDENNVGVQVGQESISPEGATAPQESLPQELNFLYPGSELTKEDMDLIDILWRQDMDLGVGREMYDQNLRRELEKEKELELHKQEEQERMEKEKNKETEVLPEPHVNYIVDNETGELIPKPETEASPETSTLSETSQSVNGLQILEEECRYRQEQEQTLQQQIQQLQQQLPQYPVEGHYDLPNTESVGVAPVEGTTSLQDEIDAMISSSPDSEASSHSIAQVGFERQDSIERRWQEVAELLQEQPLSLLSDQASSNLTHEQNQTPTVVDPSVLLQNVTLPSAMNTSSTFNQTTDLIDSGVSSLLASMTATNQSFTPYPQPSLTNSSLQDPSYNNLFNLDTQDLLFANMTAVQLSDNDSSLNHTENLLQELMDTSDVSHLNLPGTVDETLIKSLQKVLETDTVSNDSAVSSMSSPTHLQDMNDTSVISDQASLYDGLQGATGGSDYETSSETGGKTTKYLPYSPEYNLYDLGMSDTLMNQSTASNDSDVRYTPADLALVNHNHTYPIPPSPPTTTRDQPQQSKASVSKGKKPSRKYVVDEPEVVASGRDERKAKLLKIPFSMHDIIHSPVEVFNEMVSKHKLSEKQLQLIRDIRRRGKNKVAAQNCRKRKLDVILTLDEEVNQMRLEKQRLLRERHEMERQRAEYKHKMDLMYKEVFSSLRDEDGEPYDPNTYSLQQSEDGNVILVPRTNSTQTRDHEEKTTKKKKGTKKH